MNNRLYYGDNLDILRNREYFPDACVDRIYLDPPFNSNRNYNVLFKSVCCKPLSPTMSLRGVSVEVSYASNGLSPLQDNIDSHRIH